MAFGQTMWQPYAPTSATGDEGDDDKGTYKDSLIVMSGREVFQIAVFIFWEETCQDWVQDWSENFHVLKRI